MSTDSPTTPEFGDSTEQAPAHPASPLSNLRARRESILAQQVLDLPVPRWEDPTLVVRYRPVDHTLISKSRARIDKATKNQQGQVELDTNTDLIVQGCVGVFARIGGVPHACTDVDVWEPIDLDAYDGWDRFSPHLGETLGAEGQTARAVARALFFTDGDIMSHANEVIQFSGYKEADTDDEISGE